SADACSAQVTSSSLVQGSPAAFGLVRQAPSSQLWPKGSQSSSSSHSFQHSPSMQAVPSGQVDPLAVQLACAVLTQAAPSSVSRQRWPCPSDAVQSRSSAHGGLQT